MKIVPRLFKGYQKYGEQGSLEGCVWLSPPLNWLGVLFVLVALSFDMQKLWYRETRTRLEAKSLELSFYNIAFKGCITVNSKDFIYARR